MRKKLRMRWFFDVSKVKESSFFKSDLTDPLRFLMRIFWKIPIYALPDFIFQWVLGRGRHPGQGPRDPAVPVPEIWDRDRDWDSFQNPGLGPGLKFKIFGIWDWDRD